MSVETNKFSGDPGMQEDKQRPKFDLSFLAEAAMQAADRMHDNLKNTPDERKAYLIKVLEDHDNMIRVLQELENNELAKESQENTEQIILKQSANLEDRISKTENADQRARYIKQINSLDKALEYIRHSEHNPPLLRKPEQKSEQTSNEDGRKDEQAETSEIREKLLADTIMEKGGFFIFASLPKEYRPDEHSGFTSVWDSKRMDSENQYNVRNINFNNEEEIVKLGATELIRIEPCTTTNYENKEVEVKQSGVFGSFKKPIKKIEQVPTGNRIMKVSETIQGANDENAYRLIYKVNDSQLPRDAQYQDYSHRAGQQLMLEVILPESVAIDAMNQIKTDPSFVRKIVERTMLEKMNIPREAWEHGDENTNGIPLKPPYDKWAQIQNGETKIYIQENESDPIDEKFLKSIKV